MEGLEATEATSESPKPKAKTSSTAYSKKKKSSQEGKPTFYCEQHGANWTHDTKDCRYLNQKKSGGTRTSHKTWNRKAAEASEQSKKELAVLIGKTVHKAVKKQLASTDKKRKSDDECFLAEALTKDLDGFNYEAMENRNIDDDEVSC